MPEMWSERFGCANKSNSQERPLEMLVLAVLLVVDNAADVAESKAGIQEFHGGRSFLIYVQKEVTEMKFSDTYIEMCEQARDKLMSVWAPQEGDFVHVGDRTLCLAIRDIMPGHQGLPETLHDYSYQPKGPDVYNYEWLLEPGELPILGYRAEQWVLKHYTNPLWLPRLDQIIRLISPLPEFDAERLHGACINLHMALFQIGLQPPVMSSPEEYYLQVLLFLTHHLLWADLTLEAKEKKFGWCEYTVYERGNYGPKKPD